MNRRDFLVAGVGVSLSAGAAALAQGNASGSRTAELLEPSLRKLFPRLEKEAFLNAAAGTPLGSFAEEGLRRYADFWRFGHGAGREEYASEVLREVCGAFAKMIGARPSEIAFVHCTKAGEQIVLDGLPALQNGGNVVTNDLHFVGSLHNLLGLKKAGLDVRIVRARNWRVDLEAMADAIDEKTALVSLSYVSNVNGHVEPMAELAKIAHENGAYVYADIIQAAGVVPLDMDALGIDFAACSAYKWLFGPHGVGFFYARENLQGDVLRDRLFPGRLRHNYVPWVESPVAERGDFIWKPFSDARRYEAGHFNYHGYCAVYEALKLLNQIGVDKVLQHSVALVRRLRESLDPDRYPSISPDVDTPILTFTARNGEELEARLRAAEVVLTRKGNRFRVSPALYNQEADIDRLVEVLATA